MGGTAQTPCLDWLVQRGRPLQCHPLCTCGLRYMRSRNDHSPYEQVHVQVKKKKKRGKMINYSLHTVSVNTQSLACGPTICPSTYLSIYVSTDLTVQPSSSLNVPGRQYCVLGSEAVDTPILHAEGGHSPTLSVNHDQIQGKELNKVVAVVAKGLKRWRQGKRGRARKGEEIG